MKEELEYALSKLESAFQTLKEGVAQAKDELQKDGVIQRFEFTFELLWKTLKIFLSDSGLQAKTPKECLQESFRLEWITEEDVFLDMLEDRNTTSHIYERATSEAIFERIKDNYVAVIDRVLERLKLYLKEKAV